MKLESKKDGLVIVPETFIEKSFIKNTLGLKNTGDTITFTRNDNGNLETGEISDYNVYSSGTIVDSFKSKGI